MATATPTEGKHVELLMCKETFTDGVSVRGQILRTEGFSGTSLFYWYNWTRRRSLTKRSLCIEADCCSVQGIKCKDIEKMLSRVIRSPAVALRKVSKGFFLLTNVKTKQASTRAVRSHSGTRSCDFNICSSCPLKAIFTEKSLPVPSLLPSPPLTPLLEAEARPC